MAAGRKRHRHTGPGYYYEGTYGFDLVRIDDSPAEGDLVRARTPLGEGSLMPEGIDDPVQSTSHDVQAAQPVASTMPAADPLLTREQVAAIYNWRHRFPTKATYLDFLRQFEPNRFLKAVESIHAGRGQDVADALEPWYIQFRAEHGWGLAGRTWQ